MFEERKQQKEAEWIKQEEERKRAQQEKIEKIFEDKNSIWNLMSQKSAASAAVLKDAESTYLARDKHGDKKKKLKEGNKKKKGGGGGPDKDPENKYKDAHRAIEEERKREKGLSKEEFKKEATPTSKEGYYPDKNCDGRKYPVPRNDGKYGYRDKKGNYWVPTGPDNYALSHGGRHWDLFNAKGHHIGNVYPGGFYRG